MTNEQEVALRNFEARVRGLMMAYQEVKQQNAELQAQLDTYQHNSLRRKRLLPA